MTIASKFTELSSFVRGAKWMIECVDNITASFVLCGKDSIDPKPYLNVGWQQFGPEFVAPTEDKEEYHYIMLVMFKKSTSEI